MRTVLVIAPHPDDETIGCGGTLLKYKAVGCRVYWLLVTSISEAYGWSVEQVACRRQEIEAVKKLYGFDGLYELNFPTTRLDTIPAAELVGAVNGVIQEVQPDTVYLPNRSDVHSDHRVAFDAAWSSTKVFRCPFVERLLMYETLSETDFAPPIAEAAFVPNVFVDITDFYHGKEKALRVYASEMIEGFSRSLPGIEKHHAVRGSRIGVSCAEAFMLLFEKR